MRLTSHDLRDLQILKYYRLVRKWACKTYGLTDADLELLIYLDCKGRFTRQEFIDGTYTMSWDKNRWEKLRRNGWIEAWRHRNRTTIKYSVFKTSFKCSHLISRIYRILLGEEDIPFSKVVNNAEGILDKVITTDKERDEAKLALKSLLLEAEKEAFAKEVEDRKSARDMYKDDAFIQKVLATLFTAAYFGLSFMMFKVFVVKEINLGEFEISFISTIFGAMSAKVNTVVDFFFGGSSKKNEQIKK
jgi:hypothetical protein